MIVKVEMYTVECDRCKKTSGEDSDYSCLSCKESALDEAKDNEWVEHEGKTYCPDCYVLDGDDTIVVLD